MVWPLVAMAAASVIGGAVQGRAAGRAASAQQRGADAATAESARQYDTTRNDFANERFAGDAALDRISGLLGLPTEERGGYFSPQLYLEQNPDIAADQWASKNPKEHWERFGQFEGRTRPFVGSIPGRAGGAPDMSSFTASPDYNFRRTEGMRGLERSAAASGGAFSGNALRALSEFNSNLASGEYGNYFNRLASVAGLGQTATNQTAAYGADHAARAGRNAMLSADARASGIAGRANAWGGVANDLAGLYGYYTGGKQRSANAFGAGYMRDLGLG